MLEKKFDNNSVVITGKIESEFVFHHKTFNEKFYEVTIATKRLSETIDLLPVVVSERLVDVTKNMVGSIVRISGPYRSFNQHVGKNKSKLILYVLAKEWDVIEEDDNYMDTDHVYLQGFVCRKPIYRVTPYGKEITDLLVAVNHSYGKSDYIPCICWGYDARYASNYDVGTKVELYGRIQSRKYHKRLPNGEVDPEVKIAYEVSVNNIDEVLMK